MCLYLIDHAEVTIDTLSNISGGSRGGSKYSIEPRFGFSCGKKLWKPGIQQNSTI